MSVIVPWPGNDAVAQGMANALACPVLRVESRRFPDGEMYVRLHGACTGHAAAVVASLDRPDEKTPGLLFLADALRDAGAESVGLVAPYLAYLRQDTRFSPGEAVSSRTFAKVISHSFDWLVTVDPHLHRYASLSDVYSIPTTVVHAAGAVAAWIAEHIHTPILIGPDSESAQWVSDIAARIGVPWLVLEKVRHGDRDVVVSIPDASKLPGRTPVLVDDILSSGRTMIAAASQLRSLGAGDVVCIGVHAILGGDAEAAMKDAGVGRIVTCNTIAHPTNGIELTRAIAVATAPFLGTDRPGRQVRPAAEE